MITNAKLSNVCGPRGDFAALVGKAGTLIVNGSRVTFAAAGECVTVNADRIFGDNGLFVRAGKNTLAFRLA